MKTVPSKRTETPFDAATVPEYQSGFDNEFSTEAIAGALPIGRSGPQKPALGLIHEVVSGTAFTAPRKLNRRTHLYRIRPSVVQPEMEMIPSGLFQSGPFSTPANPNQIRWSPFDVPAAPTDFLDGLVTLCGNGSAEGQLGLAIHLYRANRSMQNRAFSNGDGEMLILPQLGALRFVTELGIVDAKPGEMVLIPRGCKFRVDLLNGEARGWVCENYGLPFRLPDLGLIGSVGQANGWDFQTPVAAYEDAEIETELVHKFAANLWRARLGHSPFDVVAWRGNYAPSKFAMNRFAVLGTVAFDHADPSIFCALTSPCDDVAGANADFMILPPRWIVAEDTFRPPAFHRNSVAEFLGLITGRHEGKSDSFAPGGASLHNNWAPHGPDMASLDAGRASDSTPHKLDGTLAFMIESRFPLHLTEAGSNAPERQRNYIEGWTGFVKKFPSA